MRKQDDLDDSPLRAFKTREALRGVARDHERPLGVEVAGAALATPGKATLTGALGSSAMANPLVQLHRTLSSAASDAANLEEANRTGDFPRASWAKAELNRFIAQVPLLLAMVPDGRGGELVEMIHGLAQRARATLDAGPKISSAAMEAAGRGDYSLMKDDLAPWRARAAVTAQTANAEPADGGRPLRGIVGLIGGRSGVRPGAARRPPFVDARPTPVVDGTPTPSVDVKATPVVDAKPAPTIDAKPTPAVDEKAAPVVDAMPAPTIDAKSTPLVDVEPSPAVSATEPASSSAMSTMSASASSASSASGATVHPAEEAEVHDVAAQGVAGSGGAMPHADAIAASFGPEFDIGGLSAHVGGAAATATDALGAHAYASGQHIAFSSAPDLHTAAHEATHAVLQLRGIAPAGGVGASHDAFEHHADAVADAVVARKSAAPLLAQMARGAKPTGSASARRAPAIPMPNARAIAGGLAGRGARHAGPAVQFKKTTSSSSPVPKLNSHAGDAMWSELAPGERSVAMQLTSRVDAFEGVYLRSHPAGDKDGALLPFGTLVGVSRKTEKGWYYVTVLPDNAASGAEQSAAPQGASGFIENYHVASAMPEPGARLEKVQSGALLKDIAARHYKHHFAWGNDARVYVQAIYHANKNRDAVVRKGASLEVNREALSTTSLSRALELWGQARAVEGQGLWMPSEAFVQKLKSAGTVHSASISAAAWTQAVAAAQGGWDILQYAAGFSVGLLQGAWGSLEDLFSGALDLVKTLWTVVKDFFSDFAAIRALAKQLSAAWKNRSAILESIVTDFMAKWENPNSLERGNFQGEFLGYVMAVALITGLTMGAGAAVVGAGRFGTFVRLIQIADEVGSIGTYVGKIKSKIRLPKGVLDETRRALGPTAKIDAGERPRGHRPGGETLHGDKANALDVSRIDARNAETSRTTASAKAETAPTHPDRKSGNPVKLTRRQQAIADKLPNQGSTYTFAKKEVSMADLRQLTRATGDEYSMYTQRATKTEGAKRLVIRGYGNEIRVADEQFAADLRAGLYGKWSGHTHPPGYSKLPGPADRPNIPSIQERSAIWSPDDGYFVFHRTPHGDELFERAKIRAEFRRHYGE